MATERREVSSIFVESREVTGVIYAVSAQHRQFHVERADGTRHTIQPEYWNYPLLCFWMDGRWQIAARGLPAAGLPELMRAEVWLADGQSLLKEGS